MRPPAFTLLLAAVLAPLGQARAQPAPALPALPNLAQPPAGRPGAAPPSPGVPADQAEGAAPGSAQVTFRVEDRRDPNEVAESTVLYVNRQAVGRFRLDDVAPDGALTVTVPAASHYEYALCGTITIRGESGEEVHRVNSAGQLDRVDGHVFEALGAADFTLFYLADRGGGVMPTAVRRADPGLCTPATS